jgi:predicted DNA-binding ribbon-helix-helix protein
MLPSRQELENYPDGLPVSVSIRLGSRRKSIRLGLGTLRALHEILDREDIDFKTVCSLVESKLSPRENFTEALRSYVINYFRKHGQHRPRARSR